MTDVIPATGAMLASVLRLRHERASGGLSAHAHTQFHTALRKTAWGRRCQQTYALVRDGVVLASAERYDMQGAVNGQPMAVAGIGSLCCEQEPQGSAAAIALIDWLARDSAAPLSLLFHSAAVDGLVVAGSAIDGVSVDGFAELPRIETTVRVVESTRHGAPMMTIRGGEDRDLQAIASMGRSLADPFRFHLDRDPDFIHYSLTIRRLLCGLGPAYARELQFFIAEEGVTAAAYVVLTVTPQAWVIEEWGDRDPSGARFGALLQALIAREPSRERPSIRVSLPPGFLPPQIEVVSTVAATPVIRMAVRRGSPAPFTATDVLYWPNDVF